MRQINKLISKILKIPISKEHNSKL